MRKSVAQGRPAEAGERTPGSGLRTRGPGVPWEPSLAMWPRNQSEPPDPHLCYEDQVNREWHPVGPLGGSHPRSQGLRVLQITRQRGITVDNELTQVNQLI